MRAGNDARRAVLVGEVGQRPHRVADDRHVRLGNRDELIVGMDRLRLLVGADGDRRQRRHQAAGIEHALDDRQDVLVHRDALVELAVDQQVVDAHRAPALEAIGRRRDVELALEPLEIGDQRVDEVGLDGVLDDASSRRGRSSRRVPESVRAPSMRLPHLVTLGPCGGAGEHDFAAFLRPCVSGLRDGY